MMRWMRYESQGTMHMDGAIRMLNNFNAKRRRNTSSISLNSLSISF